MPEEQSPESTPEEEARPARPVGILARAWAVLLNPANRFVVLFLVYLGVLAFFYPQFSLRYGNVVDFMEELTALPWKIASHGASASKNRCPPQA